MSSRKKEKELITSTFIEGAKILREKKNANKVHNKAVQSESTYRIYQLKGRNFFLEDGNIDSFEEDIKNGNINFSDSAYRGFLKGFETATRAYNLGRNEAKLWKQKKKSLKDYYDMIKSNNKKPDDCFLKGVEDYYNEYENYFVK